MYLHGLRGLGDGEDGYIDITPPDLPTANPADNLNDVSSGDFWDMLNASGGSGNGYSTSMPFYVNPDYTPAVDQLNAQASANLPPSGRFPPANDGSTGSPISSLFNAVGSFFTGKAQSSAIAARNTNPYGFIQRPSSPTTPGVYSPFSPGASGATLSTPLVIGGIALAAFLLMRD